MERKGSKTVYTISQILSLFSNEKDEIGIREVSQALKILPSNVHRLLSTMAEVGFLEKNLNRRYRLGERLFEVGNLYPLHFPLRKIVRPHAEELARLFGTNVHVAIPSHLYPHLVIVIDRIQNLESHPLVQRIALNVPIHCSGIGKAILAFMEDQRKERILKNIKLVRYTKNTITHLTRLRSELEQVRRNGFALDRGEEYENVWCVAAPIFQNGQLVGSLSLSDAAERMKERKISEMARALKERTGFISRQL